MKLYTKEMFLIAAEKCETSMIDAKHIMKYIDEYVTPIELLSDEDIEDKGKWVFNDAGHTIYNHYNTVPSWVEGAKWMKKQILKNK
jgi:hypothetical protein